MWLYFIQNARPELVLYFVLNDLKQRNLKFFLRYCSERNGELYVLPLVLRILEKEKPKSIGSFIGMFSIDAFLNDEANNGATYYLPTLNLLTRSNSKAKKPNSSGMFVYADMDNRVIVNRVTTVEAIISGSKISGDPLADFKRLWTELAPDKPIVIQAIAKSNYKVVGDDRYETLPPNPDEWQQLYFDFRATETGDGEILIVVFQEQMPLLTLSLKSSILASRGDVTTANPSTAKVMEEEAVERYPQFSRPLAKMIMC